MLNLEFGQVNTKLSEIFEGIQAALHLQEERLNAIDLPASPTRTLKLSDYCNDPSDRDLVDAAVDTINSLIEDNTTVDLSGDWVWPTKRLATGYHSNVHFTKGTFTRRDNIGTEYLIWLTGDDCVANSCTLDGGVGALPQWGQQGIYIKSCSNSKVYGNTFKNIGDGAIRYSGKVSAVVEPTEGVLICLNTFINCTQVTSNNTGSEDVIITDNVFRNSSVKVTQSQSLTSNGNTIITNNTFTKFTYKRNNISVQGGENVKIFGNISITDGCSFVAAYPNTSTKSGIEGVIPLRNLKISNNSVVSKDVRHIIYIEGKDDVQDKVTTNKGSHLIVKDNDIIALPSTTQEVRFLTLYTQYTNKDDPTPIAEKVIIKGNELFGEVAYFVRSYEQGFRENNNMLIENNYCEYSYKAFFTAHLNGSHGKNGEVVLRNNSGKTTSPIVTDQPSYQKSIGKIELDDNKFTISKGSLAGYKGLVDIMLGKGSNMYKVTNNEFTFEEGNDHEVFKFYNHDTVNDKNMIMYGNKVLNLSGEEIKLSERAESFDDLKNAWFGENFYGGVCKTSSMSDKAGFKSF